MKDIQFFLDEGNKSMGAENLLIFSVSNENFNSIPFER